MFCMCPLTHIIEQLFTLQITFNVNIKIQCLNYVGLESVSCLEKNKTYFTEV